MAAASPRREAMSATPTAARVGPISVAEGASAASAAEPTKNKDDEGPVQSLGSPIGEERARRPARSSPRWQRRSAEAP